MKKVLLILAVSFLVFNCSKDNDEECEDLAVSYAQALTNAGGSQSAIEELTSQYNDRKAELGCD